MNIINNHIESISQLCNAYHVDKMYAFGSIVRNDFNEHSDVDLLVKFKSIDLADYFDNYITLKEQLENLLGRDVDLLEEQTLKNPVLIKSVNQNKKLIYG